MLQNFRIYFHYYFMSEYNSFQTEKFLKKLSISIFLLLSFVRGLKTKQTKKSNLIFADLEAQQPDG